MTATAQSNGSARGRAAIGGPRARVTIADALALPVMRQGLPEVVVGRGQLDRPIRWAHVGEAPNIASVLTGGELLLTTGMGIGARAAEQRAFVAALADRRVAAVVIELGHVFTELPEPLVNAALERGMPLIALRREVPFVAVTEAIHTELVAAQYTLQRRGDALYRKLVRLLLDGGGIPDVLNALSDLLGNPVYLEDAHGRLLQHAGSGPGGSGDAVCAWEAARAGSRSRGPWRAAIVEPVPMHAGTADGRLVALPLTRPFDDTGRLALARAADIVALALLRARQEEELLAGARGNLLAELAAGNVRSGDAAHQAATMGFNADCGAGTCLLPFAAEVTAAATEPAAWGLLVHDVQARLERRGRATLVGTGHVGSLLGLVRLRAAEDRAAEAELVAAVTREVVDRRLGNATTVVVVADASSWEQAGDALASCSGGAASGAALPAAHWHDARSVGLHQLVWHWRDDPELSAFVRRTLGPLVEREDGRLDPLICTLEALCENGGCKARAARALHLNRQALYHRLARIERLLAVDLADPGQLLTLHLALRARRALR